MTILCLCREEHHWKLIPGYADAFRRRGIEFFCVSDLIPFDASLDEVLRTCPNPASAIFHFESAHPLFPRDLEKSQIPTICFHPDTYAFTQRRIRWSMVFDHAAVFHPGYVEQFAAAGHPGAFLLPHAVRSDFFAGSELPREYEIGWVGQTSGPFYTARAQWLPRLAKEFRTNDWSRPYTVQEVAEVYRKSCVVVNIGRDDFPQDANLRVFEAGDALFGDREQEFAVADDAGRGVMHLRIVDPESQHAVVCIPQCASVQPGQQLSGNESQGARKERSQARESSDAPSIVSRKPCPATRRNWRAAQAASPWAE